MTSFLPNNNQVGVGIVGKEAFVTVVTGLSEKEVEVLQWAGALTDTDEAVEIDETGGIVAVRQADSLEESVAEATRKALK